MRSPVHEYGGIKHAQSLAIGIMSLDSNGFSANRKVADSIPVWGVTCRPKTGPDSVLVFGLVFGGGADEQEVMRADVPRHHSWQRALICGNADVIHSAATAYGFFSGRIGRILPSPGSSVRNSCNMPSARRQGPGLGYHLQHVPGQSLMSMPAVLTLAWHEICGVTPRAMRWVCALSAPNAHDIV